VFGSGSLSDETKKLPQMIEVGEVQDDRTRRLVYSAADVFVLPSTEDNLPLTGLEAMACGTPVIGFDAGGIPDYVIPDQTGMLAPNGDAIQLGRLLESVSQNPDRLPAMGDRARRLILDQFESDLEAQSYLQLYRRVLGTTESVERRAA
jgi:glycosyltransferase involved in cell wall biosynthesis